MFIKVFNSEKNHPFKELDYNPNAFQSIIIQFNQWSCESHQIQQLDHPYVLSIVLEQNTTKQCVRGLHSKLTTIKQNPIKLSRLLFDYKLLTLFPKAMFYLFRASQKFTIFKSSFFILRTRYKYLLLLSLTVLYFRNNTQNLVPFAINVHSFLDAFLESWRKAMIQLTNRQPI